MIIRVLVLLINLFLFFSRINGSVGDEKSEIFGRSDLRTWPNLWFFKKCLLRNGVGPANQHIKLSVNEWSILLTCLSCPKNTKKTCLTVEALVVSSNKLDLDVFIIKPSLFNYKFQFSSSARQATKINQRDIEKSL